MNMHFKGLPEKEKEKPNKTLFVYYRKGGDGFATEHGSLYLTYYVHQKGELVLADGEWLFSAKIGGTMDSTPRELIRMALKKTDVRVGIQTAEALGIADLPGLILHPEYIYQRALSGLAAFQDSDQPLGGWIV